MAIIKRLTVIVCILLMVVNVSRTLDAVFMTEICNGVISGRLTGRIESSRSVYSKPNVNCKLTITVPSDRTILLVFQRFKLEQPLAGACVDYLNIFDGDSLTSPRLNADPLCDEHLKLKYESTGSSITFQFVTDYNAPSKGFDVLFAARKKAPCESTQFACKNSYCVEADQICDDYNQCGDGSDETDCSETVNPDAETPLNLGLVIGLATAGVVLLIIMILVGIVIYKNVTYKKFLEEYEIEQMRLEKQEMEARKEVMHYPITNEYSKFEKPRKKKKTKVTITPAESYEYSSDEERKISHTPVPDSTTHNTHQQGDNSQT